MLVLSLPVTVLMGLFMNKTGNKALVAHTPLSAMLSEFEAMAGAFVLCFS